MTVGKYPDIRIAFHWILIYFPRRCIASNILSNINATTAAGCRKFRTLITLPHLARLGTVTQYKRQLCPWTQLI